MQKINEQEIDDNTLEFLTLALYDIVKGAFEVDGCEQSLHKDIINFAIIILNGLTDQYKASMHLIESISQNLRMSHYGADQQSEFDTFVTQIVEICIQKTIYPEFFDIETMIPNKRQYRQKFKFTKNPREKVEEDEDVILDMSDEQSAFVHVRNELKLLILEVSLKAKKLDKIFTQLIEVSKVVMENQDGCSEEQLNFRIEAILMVFLHFLQGGKKDISANNTEDIVGMLQDFFLQTESRNFFAGKDAHCLVSKKYVDCLIELKHYFKTEDEKNSLVSFILEILFEKHVLLSDDPGTISYFISCFHEFMKCNIHRIGEDMCQKIAEDLKNSLIPNITSGDEQYSVKTPTLFEIFGYITQNSSRSLECRVEATKDALNFIKSMYENALTLHHFKLCQRCTLSYLSKVSTPIEPEIGMLFNYLMEMFVKKVCPDYDISNITAQAIFTLKVEFSNTEEKQSMIQLRTLIQEVYMSVAPKIDSDNRLILYKTALPVIISCLKDPVDPFTNEVPMVADIESSLYALQESIRFTCIEAVQLHENFSGRLLFLIECLYQKLVNENIHPKSDEYIEITSTISEYLRFIKNIIFFDSHSLFVTIPEAENAAVITKLMEFLNNLLWKPLTQDISELALEISMNLVKELTQYQDDDYLRKKHDMQADTSNKSIVGHGKLSIKHRLAD